MYKGEDEGDSDVSMWHTCVSFRLEFALDGKSSQKHAYRLLGADQKGRVKANMQKEGGAQTPKAEDPADDILFFHRCQSSSASGDTKGCGFFQLLDCEREGKGPLIGQRMYRMERGNSVLA